MTDKLRDKLIKFLAKHNRLPLDEATDFPKGTGRRWARMAAICKCYIADTIAGIDPPGPLLQSTFRWRQRAVMGMPDLTAGDDPEPDRGDRRAHGDACGEKGLGLAVCEIDKEPYIIIGDHNLRICMVWLEEQAAASLIPPSHATPGALFVPAGDRPDPRIVTWKREPRRVFP